MSFFRKINLNGKNPEPVNSHDNLPLIALAYSRYKIQLNKGAWHINPNLSEMEESSCK